MAPIPTATEKSPPGNTRVPSDTPIAQGRFLLGSALLLAAVASTAMLTVQQISRANIPGCGPGSACGELARSVWGKVPVVEWPVSFLGLAYFAALLVAWITVRGVVMNATAMRWLIRIGALASLMFIGVMVSKGMICPYCLVAHIANLAFVALVEVTGRSAATRSSAVEGGRFWQGASAVAIVFLAGTLAIAVIDQQAARTAGERQEADFNASMQEMLKAAGDPGTSAGPSETPDRPTGTPPGGQATTTPVSQEAPAPDASATAAAPGTSTTPDPAPAPTTPTTPDAQASTTPPATQPSTPPAPAPSTQTTSTPTPQPTAPVRSTDRGVSGEQPAGFVGRHRWGPEQAGIRIVMFTGYQCPDCRDMDAQVKQVLTQWPELVTFSIKHFPMSNLCNPHMGQSNLHPNACWAARAAEAASIIGGFDAFERMHNWLYRRGGAFTEAELRQGLLELGFEPNYFISVMSSPQTLQRVQADIEEAMLYGLSHTPMIFINGVELKGWRTPNALVRAVDVLAATRPPARGPESDRPPRAGDKALADWREAPQQAWPSRQRSWALGGSEEAPVKIQVFGDFQEANTAQVDEIIRNAMAGRDDIRYEFRYFPADQTCNPHVQRSPYPLGCRAARVAETAGQMGGEQAYWRMHEWLMANQRHFNDENVRRFVGTIGLDPATFMAALEGDGAPEVAKAISDDISIGQRLQMPSIPRIFINGKVVARWNLPGEFTIERIIEEAAAGR